MKHEEVYLNGEDNGWIAKQNFWFDENHPNGFNIVDLDSIYPEKYFEVDHVKPETIKAYVGNVMEFCTKINGKGPSIVKEFGCAGGWFSEEFVKIGVRVVGIEGSHAGMIRSIDRLGEYHTGKYGFQRRDLRLPVETENKVDIALCTEVAEHIEPPFSATLVKSLCDASDLVWFSFEPPNTNPAHIHHPNEMPAKFWINLFDFYGYGCYMLPDWVFDQTEGRGRMIFYNKETYANNEFFKQV